MSILWWLDLKLLEVLEQNKLDANGSVGSLINDMHRSAAEKYWWLVGQRVDLLFNRVGF